MPVGQNHNSRVLNANRANCAPVEPCGRQPNSTLNSPPLDNHGPGSSFSVPKLRVSLDGARVCPRWRSCLPSLPLWRIDHNAGPRNILAVQPHPKILILSRRVQFRPRVLARMVGSSNHPSRTILELEHSISGASQTDQMAYSSTRNATCGARRFFVVLRANSTGAPPNLSLTPRPTYHWSPGHPSGNDSKLGPSRPSPTT